MAAGKKTNWNKFEDAVNRVVRPEVCRVFLWLYQGGNKYVGEYLDEIPGGRNGLNKDERDALTNREPPTNMDISLLYRLLQRTCGLAEASDPVWFHPPDPNSTSLEHTLYLIKEERNKLGHEGHTREAREMSDADLNQKPSHLRCLCADLMREVARRCGWLRQTVEERNKLSHEGHTREAREMSDAELDQKLSHLHRLCTDLLMEAARRCGRLREIGKFLDDMEARLQDVHGVTPDGFVLMAREEKLRVPRTKMADEWYHQPLLRLQGQRVGLADLLKWTKGVAPRSLLVTGEEGVGKSSLCRYLEECWLRPRSDGDDLLQRYRLVLRVRCRDICTCNAVQLLKEELLREVASQCSDDTLSEILLSVPVLWVLDGLEDATNEAFKLLSSLLSNRPPKSTVLVTSRPEFGRDFLEQRPDSRPEVVRLLGTDPLETINSFILSAKCDESTVRHAKALKEEFKKLDRRVQQDLQNPLKLRLALQGWEAMPASKFQLDFELSRLYQRITDAQIESLSEKLTEESTMAKAEATQKVRKWFSFLCESTFHLVQSRTMVIGATREEFFRKLEDKCDDLRISSSNCMSTFLASPDSVFSPGNSRYSFYHDSHVHYLAARHIASVMEGSRYVPADTLRLFNIAALQEHASEAPPLLHFLHVLLLLVSLIDASTPDGNTRMVIKLLLNAMPLIFDRWMWFEVARKASYEPKVMREIGRVMPNEWIIEEPSIEAARKMVQYRMPNVVSLRVYSKPEEVKELEPLIRTLASLPVVIMLYLLNHTMDLSGNDIADAYLEIICRKESRCVLDDFEAHLGNTGHGLLKHPRIINCCTAMTVKVKSIESLESLCECVQRIQSLAQLNLVVAMKKFPDTSAKLPYVRNSIYLPYVTEETAANAAKFVAQLSPCYDQLAVDDVAHSAIETFIRGLQKKYVTVDFFKGVVCRVGSRRCFLGLGPLPLQYPWEEFRHRWSTYRSVVRTARPPTDACPDTLPAARQ